MTRHRARVYLGYAGPDKDGNPIPYKWFGTCACGFRAMSWHWQREDGSGALQMTNDHVALTIINAR